MEILDRLSKWTEDNNEINPEQSGFRKHRGVNDQLFLFQQFLTQAKNRKRHMHAVFIDFTKAFDTIDHKKLLFKLKQKNIPKTLLLLLRSYLENRTCFVHTGKIASLLHRWQVFHKDPACLDVRKGTILP